LLDPVFVIQTPSQNLYYAHARHQTLQNFPDFLCCKRVLDGLAGLQLNEEQKMPFSGSKIG